MHSFSACCRRKGVRLELLLVSDEVILLLLFYAAVVVQGVRIGVISQSACSIELRALRSDHT